MSQVPIKELLKSQRLPIWARLLLSIAYAALAALILVYMSLADLLPMSVMFGLPIIIISLTLGGILLQLRYSRWYVGALIPLLALLLWFGVLFPFAPSLVHQERMAEKPKYLADAAKIVPPYPGLKLEEVTYSPREAFVKPASVSYDHHSTNLKEDYSKMRDFYKAELSKKGWVVFQVSEDDKLDYGYTVFGKAGNDSTRVSVGYNKISSKVGVGVSF